MSKHVFGGVLLVAGTAVGAGMLALPVVTAEGGFFPAVLVYILSWGCMTSTGLLMLEICLEMPPGANLITMAGTYLGKGGKIATWVLYLFLFYCLTIAYLAGGGGLLKGWIGKALLPEWGGTLFFLFLLAPIVYAGAKIVDRVNKVLMVGLIASYLAFVVFCLPYVHLAPLQRSNWTHSFSALPVILTAFSYQGIIPTLTAYLKRDAKSVRIAIVGGTGLAFIIYLLWEFLILGIVSEGELKQARELGLTAVTPLRAHVTHDALSLMGQAFAFFAIATSFLGVTLGLLDFLADGLSLPKKGLLRLQLVALTFGPPAVVAFVSPSLFLTALSMAGGIGCALLLGLFPLLMTYVARYTKKRPLMGEIQLGGGKGLLFLLLFFVISVVVLEIRAEWMRWI